MTRFAAFAFVLMLASPAFAQGEKPKVEVQQLPPLGKAAPVEAYKGPAPAPTPEEDAKALTPEEQAILLCQTTQIMGDYGAEAPVAGPDYQPGVDAYGNSVVPADGQAQPVYTVPDRIDIPLNIDVLKTVGVITTPTPGLSTNVGTVSILKGGQVLFNGQDAGSSVQTYCNTHLSEQQKAQ